MDVEKELVKNYFKIKNPSGEGILKVVDLEDAVEIATKKIWKHPAKGEYPENNRTVILAFTNSKYCNVGFYSTKDMTANYEGFYLLSRNGVLEISDVVAWCELPIYKA